MDFSEKKLYKCESCGRWFCEKHIKPRTFLIRRLDDIPDEQIPEGIGLDDIQTERAPEQADFMDWIKIPFEIMDEFKSRKGKQKERKRGDTHPDFQYTKKWLEEVDVEEKKRGELIKRALNRMNRYYSREKLHAVNLKYVEPRDKPESEEKLETERHFPTKEIAFLLVLLILAIVFWFAPTIISYLQRI
jgi:hypothetical protein